MPDLIGHLVQKHSETARDTPKKDGIASSFRIIVKVREMDQSICSVAESLCLVYTLTKTRAILYQGVLVLMTFD